MVAVPVYSDERSPMLERLDFPCYRCGYAFVNKDAGLLFCENFSECAVARIWYREVWDQILPEAIEA